MTNEEKKVKDFMIGQGFDPSLTGFNYLADAVICFQFQDRICEIYDTISCANNVKKCSVERCIRQSIKKSNYSGNKNGYVIGLINYYTLQ